MADIEVFEDINAGESGRSDAPITTFEDIDTGPATDMDGPIFVVENIRLDAPDASSQMDISCIEEIKQVHEPGGALEISAAIVLSAAFVDVKSEYAAAGLTITPMVMATDQIIVPPVNIDLAADMSVFLYTIGVPEGLGLTPAVTQFKERTRVTDGIGLKAELTGFKKYIEIAGYEVIDISVRKNIQDTMYEMCSTLKGETGPAEFTHVKLEATDAYGVTQHIFSGIIPKTSQSIKHLENTFAVTAYDYGWYMSAQYLQDADMVVNLDGTYTTWAAWITHLLEETGIVPYRITNPSAGNTEFVYRPGTTKLKVIKDICDHCSFIFEVRWGYTGSSWKPYAYFVHQDSIDHATLGLDLPAGEEVVWGDETLVDIPTVEDTPDEKINRVRIRGQGPDGTWYTKVLQTSDVTNGLDLPREFYEESATYDTQSKVDARATAVFNYFQNRTYTVSATFRKRYDLRLYQKIRFTGSGFPSNLLKLTDGTYGTNWLRIVDIQYNLSHDNKTVVIKAISDRDQAIQRSFLNKFMNDSLTETEILIDDALAELPMPDIGTVVAISGNTATVELERGGRVKARLL